MKSGGPIGRRITLALVGVVGLALVVVGVLFYGFLGRYVVARQQETLTSHAGKVAVQLESFASGGLDVGPGPQVAVRTLRLLLSVDLELLPARARIMIVSGGQLVAGAPASADLTPSRELLDAAGKLATKGPASRLTRLDNDGTFIVAAAPVSLQSENDGLVIVTLPVRAAAGDRAGLLRVLLAAGVIGSMLAIIVGAFLGAWLTRPLRRLAASAHVMAEGSYAEPVTGKYAGEVYDLAAGLETMRREVGRSERSLRSFVSSAAHELRTPLTSIEGFSQALLDGTAETPDEHQRSAAAIYREARRLHRMVDALLTLSRFDSREFRPMVMRFDAGRLVEEEVQRLVDAGVAPPGRVEVRRTDDASVVTDPDMLRQVVANLLRNAVQYGGDDPVVAEAQTVSGLLHLRVTNGGVPILPDDRARVFERFYRGRSSYRSEGFGLGLPLVREICEVLGGGIELVGPGPATTFEVTIPALPVGPPLPVPGPHPESPA